jgi:hypothetical protein
MLDFWRLGPEREVGLKKSSPGWPGVGWLVHQSGGLGHAVLGVRVRSKGALGGPENFPKSPQPRGVPHRGWCMVGVPLRTAQAGQPRVTARGADCWLAALVDFCQWLSLMVGLTPHPPHPIQKKPRQLYTSGQGKAWKS